ncbi:hypothetical protein KsCSTR_23440 [Candidatus Kuenenia stuttgartiensis]|uniref:Uncharacterized protein n=1 Tax=Kuenenia stuttgartiensis TaxID=174633 RepID=Q1Q3M6_KUEST|nr:hypothetical protein KsCSTR_23440 [Candidatus Kuenenia stuttgartiensis]CAJ74612.1 unknown protein [Candidatus Kuenenia stuttgartiensis]
MLGGKWQDPCFYSLRRNVETGQVIRESCQSQICVLYLIWYQIKFHQIRSSDHGIHA